MGKVFFHCISDAKNSKAYITVDKMKNDKKSVIAGDCVEFDLPIGSHRAEIKIKKGHGFTLDTSTSQSYAIEVPIRTVGEEVHVDVRIGRMVNRIELRNPINNNIPPQFHNLPQNNPAQYPNPMQNNPAQYPNPMQNNPVQYPNPMQNNPAQYPNPMQNNPVQCPKPMQNNLQNTTGELTDQVLFCRRCGKRLLEDSQFCPYCGTPK